MGINLKGSFVPDARIVLWRTGAGMKIDKPLKRTRPFSSGAGMFAQRLGPTYNWKDLLPPGPQFGNLRELSLNQ